MRRRLFVNANCRPGRLDRGGSLKSIVRLYRAQFGARCDDELDYFREMPSLKSAIHNAAQAINQRKGRFGHQCRLRSRSLQQGENVLLAEMECLRSCRTFHELHALLRKLLLPVRGLGDLYAYDTALRLGAFLGLMPNLVYLHAGTKSGARALGMDVSRGFIEVQELPKALQVLKPHEIEDILCIFKDRFVK